MKTAHLLSYAQSPSPLQMLNKLAITNSGIAPCLIFSVQRQDHQTRFQQLQLYISPVKRGPRMQSELLTMSLTMVLSGPRDERLGYLGRMHSDGQTRGGMYALRQIHPKKAFTGI